MAKKNIRVEVTPRNPNEPVERMIKRFSKKVKKERIIESYVERSTYEKPSKRRRREKKRREKVLEKLRIEREKTYEQ
ncbi:MAG TPA: 30S ribosomal protein S21 [Balneola sp.]|nr:30S ribosomal protein S21 [Balneola sp.]